MSSPVTAFPAFLDLKKKVAHEGGFSDGGVVCISKTLTTAGIEIAPTPGTALGGFSTPAGAANPPTWIDANASAMVVNNNSETVGMEASVVFEDGSSAVLETYDIPPGISPIPLFGLIMTYPNKMRLKLVPYGTAPLPTKRVLFKAALVEFDKPADLEAA